MDPSARLGPFRLIAPLGEGAQGQVWRAVHDGPEGRPVAIKVLSGEGSGLHAGFVREIEAVARLDHPRIVPIFDAGLVGEGTPLVVGRPWFAMELVTGGTLRSRVGRAPWWSVRATLLSILDGLAHAHARGLVHLDLKPANVLVGPSATKIADFGIARLLDEAGEGSAVRGTPAYMAPEQVDGRWRDQGPPTDLYALGCLAYELWTGAPPFAHARSAMELMVAHLGAPPPPLPSQRPGPEGLEAWLHRLLAKSPADRFPTAAAAAAELLSLPSLAESPPSPDAAAAMGELTTLLELEATLDLARPAERTAATRPTRITQATLPTGWSRVASWSGDLHLSGAGLGLLHIREVPMYGRREARDELWAGARRALTEETPETWLLQGAWGLGTSRLARWLVERLRELGAATVITANHRPVDTDETGLLAMARRWLRCVGLPSDGCRERLDAAVPGLPDPVAAEFAVALATGQATRLLAGGVELSGPDVLHPLLTAAVVALAEQGPVVVAIDEAQWGPDSLAWVEHVQQAIAGRALPLLVVLAVDTTSLEGRGSASRRLRALTRQPGVHEIGLAPLDAGSMTELITQGLGLAGPIVTAIHDRAAGRPRVAVESARLLAKAGQLRLEGRALRAPASAVDLLRGQRDPRWKRVLQAATGGETRALQLAAVLGEPLDAADWQATAAEARVELSEGLLADLREHGALGGERAITFGHPALRDHLLALADAEGRLVGWHRAARAALGEGESEEPARAYRRRWRRAVHAVGAGDDDALDALREGLRASVDKATNVERGRLLAAWEAHREREPVDGDDEANLWALLVRSGLQGRTPGPDTGVELAREAQRWAEARGRGDLHAKALAHEAVRWLQASKGEPSVAASARAIELATAAEAHAVLGHALWIHGAARCNLLDDPGGLESLDAVTHDPRRWWRHEAPGIARYTAGRFYTNRFDAEPALAMLDEALAVAREQDARRLQLLTLNMRGTALAMVGRADEAERDFREVVAFDKEHGTLDFMGLEHLGLVLADKGEWETARELFAEALHRVPSSLPLTYRAGLLAELLGVSAAMGEWSRLDAELDRLDELLQRAEAVGFLVPVRLSEAAERAAADDEGRRAARLQALAERWWPTLPPVPTRAVIERVMMQRWRERS